MMNLTEDQLRAVLRATGDEIAPDRVRRLTLPAGDDQPGRRYRRLRGNRWLPAVAAAAAVAAVAVAATAIAIGSGGHPAGVTADAGARPGGLPPYYVAITVPGTNGQSVTTVGNTKTGAVLATVSPPDGSSFVAAAAGHGDQSFLLEARQRDDRIGIYLLRFNPASHGTSLSRLPIPALQSVASLAMSPSGTELAVSTTAAKMAQLQIYALSGRLIRQWQDPGEVCPLAGFDGLPCLSWTESGYLAFYWVSPTKDTAADGGIRLILASAASGSLVGASRLVAPTKTFTIGNLNFLLSGNGATIDAWVRVPHAARPGLSFRFEELSVATGKVTGKFWPLDGFASAWWSDRTGSRLMIVTAVGSVLRFGILTRGSFTPLGRAGNWSSLAF
jgi:hypothetical protein